MEPATQGTGQQGRQQQPVYDIRNGGHYAAKLKRACRARVVSRVPLSHFHVELSLTDSQVQVQRSPPKDMPLLLSCTLVNQGLQGTARDILTTYWQHVINHLESDNHDYKIHQLPLARIKKVMKADPEVKMISAEAPILFAKGCDIFITELTMRAWIHAEDNKRRTLQRSDIAAALSKSDMFDFLIDITAGTAPGPSATPGQMPTQHGVQPHMGPADYGSLGQHGLPQEQEYRPQPAMYPGAVQSDPTASYGQPPNQMFEGMYAYPHLPPQQ
ncbi:uncharacterized protein N7477_003095 [Penicillium maclennaniae]|uniref:uncharacterized protein n=1 Tax=Penicillium maclennaniae TaxID=1343394 RepID=UPI0025400BE1|nr:uncharacterized protein N7477_003095 [Penicillium maclennaniae]KAJ5677462.1 hypothetical protein N7477_003095 [Penicillium maclennaniae]